jgi:hypothetical protein
LGPCKSGSAKDRTEQCDFSVFFHDFWQKDNDFERKNDGRYYCTVLWAKRHIIIEIREQQLLCLSFSFGVMGKD